MSLITHILMAVNFRGMAMSLKSIFVAQKVDPCTERHLEVVLFVFLIGNLRCYSHALAYQ